MSLGAVILFQDLPTSSVRGMVSNLLLSIPDGSLLKLAIDTVGIFSYPDPPFVTVIEVTLPPVETVAKPVATLISCVFDNFYLARYTINICSIIISTEEWERIINVCCYRTCSYVSY